MEVCRNMMTNFEIKMDVLNDEEDWQLFSQNARDVIHLEEIRPFAEAIVRECCRQQIATGHHHCGSCHEKKSQWSNCGSMR